MQSKIASYVGFALKAGKVVFGVDVLETYRKKVYLLIASYDLSENSCKAVEKIQKKFKCAMLKTVGFPLNDLVYRQNCKLIALTDKNLSDAVLKAAKEDQNFGIYPWEEKE